MIGHRTIDYDIIIIISVWLFAIVRTSSVMHSLCSISVIMNVSPRVGFVDDGRKWSLSGRISDTVFSSDYSLKAWYFAISIESGISHNEGTSQNLQKSFFLSL